MNQIFFVLSVTIMGLILSAGCTTQQSAQVTSTPTPIPIPSTTNVSPATQAGMKNIVKTLEGDGRFTTLVTAANAAGLDDMLGGNTLSSSERFTVFAPTDEAFKKLSAGSIDTFLKDPQGDLLQILLYHVVSGKVMAADLKNLTSIETLQGGFLPISVSKGVISVDGAQVIVTDIECTNGVIHVVDTIMLPPA
jgi:transforming growth factor-beta-induced protein